MRSRLLCAAAVLALVVGAAPSIAAENQTYPIRLHRTSKVGDRYKIEAMGASRVKEVVQPAAGEAETIDYGIGIRLDGVARVAEVTPKGRETKIEFTVKECVVSTGKEAKQLFPEGTVVVATRGKDGTKFAIKNGPEVPSAIEEALELVIDISDPEGATDDEIFGSKENRRVGDTWPIDATAATKELARIGLAVKEENIFGDTTLIEPVKVGTTDCLRIGLKFKARQIKSVKKPDAKDDKLSVVDGHYTVTGKIDLPLDTTRPMAHDETKLDIETRLVGRDEDQNVVRVTRTVERLVDRTVQKLN